MTYDEAVDVVCWAAEQYDRTVVGIDEDYRIEEALEIVRNFF